MTQQLGRLLLMKISDGATPTPAYSNLCGFKARSFNLSANEVDTTLPDCNNPGGPVQKTSSPGMLSRTFSGSGTFVSGAAAALLMTAVRGGLAFDAQVIVPGEGTYAGSWIATDFEFSGEMEGSMEFSATFTAGGALTFTAEAATPVNSLLPSISGIAQVGQTLTVRPGIWSGNPILGWQWKKGGVNIAGATGKTYVPVVGDIGAAITVSEAANNSSGSASATSAATANVIAA